MKKALKTLVIALSIIVLGTPCSVSQANSLDSLIQDNQKNESLNQDKKGNDRNNKDVSFNTDDIKNQPVGNEDLIRGAQDALNIGADTEASRKTKSYMGLIFSYVVQVLAYFITGLVIIRVLIDLLYIIAPFLRSKLDGGASAGAQGGMTGGAGGSMNSGFNSNSFGMNSGFNSNRYGMNSGYNNAGMSSMNNGNHAGAGRCYVSEAAIQAVTMASQVDPNTGKRPNVIKAYAKDMIVILVGTPILLVLAISGALSNLGYAIGEFCSKVISKFIGMIG